MRAILELRAIGKEYPMVKNRIDEWIRRNVKEMGISVSMDAISYQDKEHVEYNLKKAANELGTKIAVHYNPYPLFQKCEDKPYLYCTLSAFVFTNEYGK